MLTCFIRNFYIFIFSIYIFYKLLNIAPVNKSEHSFLIFTSILFSGIISILFIGNPSLNWIFLIFSFSFLMLIFTKVPIATLYITSLFSCVLSFSAFSLSGIITAYALLPFYYKEYEIPWLIIRTLAGIFHFLLIYYCFQIPRLKKGMSFIYSISSRNIGSTICLLFFIFFNIFSQSSTYKKNFIFTFSFTIIFLCCIIIYWWNYHITQTYIKYLKKNEIDSLNLLLEERNQEILSLRNENDKLARIIHKDNKILPALGMFILTSYENDLTIDLSAFDSKSSLCLNLKQLYEERVQILKHYQTEFSALPQTSFASVNAILSYMQTECKKQNTPYQVILFDDLTSTIPDKISEYDFVHVLSDLLSNAINACKNVPSGSVQIFLGTIDDISTIKIQNTGNLFHIDTLKYLGQTRHTTHADTGGQGIGLMDLWQLKEKYKATLFIDENTLSSSVYTCMNILFNHNNHYLIQSDRYKELHTYINRPDIIILPKE